MWRSMTNRAIIVIKRIEVIEDDDSDPLQRF